MREFYKPGIDDEESDNSFDIVYDTDMDDDGEGGGPSFIIPSDESSNSEGSIDSDDSSDPEWSPSSRTRSGAAGSSVQNNNKSTDVPVEETEEQEEEEEDETVRAIVAAIKKPRTNPPEIKVSDFVSDVSFHPEQDLLAVGTMVGDVLLYNYSNEGNTLKATHEIHTKAIRDIEFSEDGTTIFSSSKDKSIMLTDVETGKLKKFYDNAHEYSVYKLYIIDSNLFATGDDFGTVKLWDVRTNSEVFGLREVEDYVSAMLTNDAKKLLLVASGDGYLTTINIGSRKMYVQSEPYEEELTCMGLFRNDSKVIVGTSKGRLYSFNWGQFGYHSDMFPGIKSPISNMLPLTDRIGCVAGEEGILRACHIAPFKNLGIVGQHTMPVESLDINHTGEFIASSSHNNDIRFWNIKYFEDFGDIKYNEKHNSYKERQHNLPSSKFSNASDFFADLANSD